MRTFKPLGNRVVIRRSKVALSKGGILLPEAACEKPKSGEVIAVGPGKVNEQGHMIPIHVKLGDHVLFSSYAGSAIDMDSSSDEELLVMSEDDILATIG